jgi:hypothetical protein
LESRSNTFQGYIKDISCEKGQQWEAARNEKRETESQKPRYQRPQAKKREIDAVVEDIILISACVGCETNRRYGGQ